MPMALQTPRNGKVKISEANAWGNFQHHDRQVAVYVNTQKSLVLKEKKRATKREWMTVGALEIES
jgi:hypothetical protein